MKLSKIILPIILVGLIIGLSYWLIPQKEPDPNIELPITNHDFGEVLYGDIPSHEFEVLNSGNSDLKIEKISTSCGCTTAEISSETIMPGEKATLTVYFNPAIHGDDTDLGQLTRVVYINSNDPTNPESEVKIEANVYKE